MGIQNTRHSFEARKIKVRLDDPVTRKKYSLTHLGDRESAQDWINRLAAASDLHPEHFSIQVRRLG